MEQLLSKIEDDIIRIKKRLIYLEAIAAELSKHAGKGRFPVKNDIIYRMVWDSYDMVVIDLASLCRAMMQRGGFFRQLNNHIRKLQKPILKRIQDKTSGIVFTEGSARAPAEYEKLRKEMSDDVKTRLFESKSAAFGRLFPASPEKAYRFPLCFLSFLKGRESRVTREQITGLKDRFENLTKAVIKDRDSRRAHKYERRKTDKDVEMLSIEKVRFHFEQLEEIINDLRLLTTESCFVYNPPLYADPGTVAKDLVDMIFWGSFQMIFSRFGIGEELTKPSPQKTYWARFRDDFYKERTQSMQKRLISTLTEVLKKK